MPVAFRSPRSLVAALVAPTVAAALVLVPSGPIAAAATWTDTSADPAQRARAVVAAMTLSEKIQYLHGVDTGASPVDTVGYIPPLPRLHLPAITMTDGPAGVRNGRNSTELPASISQAASFDVNDARAYGTVVGRDARDLGQDQVFGPGMNIARVPFNGRNFEYFSEDPVLSGRIAAANVRGIQANGVVATVKHYLANNQEKDRTTVSANIDQRTLHEIYEKNFGIAVSEGHPGSVMCSYNRINDTYSCSDATTLIGALRHELGFDGYVVSDYPATHATTDVKNGLNVELPVGKYLTEANVRAALDAKRITTADIDARVTETLTVLFRLGVFDRPLTVSPIDQDADNAVAQHLTERSAVLLKNTDRVLPLTAAAHRIAVIGTTAKTSAQGGGSSQVQALSVDNAFDAIVARGGGGRHVDYADGSDVEDAASTARDADVALVFVRDTSSEGSDRSTLALSGNQDDLIRAVAAANRHTIVVLETGAPVLMPWLADVPGVLEAWYPGARGGAAIAHLVFGDVNPSGKLPQTWPAGDAQTPLTSAKQYPGVDGEETYSEGLEVGYRWYDAHGKTPLFPFGYGLSYTSFAYTHPSLDHAKGTASGSVRVGVDVTNTGTRTGAEAVQVYVTKPAAAAEPAHELAAFGKVVLRPGETRRVTLTVAPRELSYWDTATKSFRVAAGPYRFAVGGSSRSLPLSVRYTVTS